MAVNMQKKSLAEEISTKLAEAIIRGDYGPDGRIGTKDDMQTRLGVAKGTINEIVRLLSSRKVIHMRPGPKGGIFAVSLPSVQFHEMIMRFQNDAHLASECFQIKDILDPVVAADAACHRTAKDIEELRETCRAFQEETDPKSRVQLNWKLHRRISNISANKTLALFYAVIMDVLEGEIADMVMPQSEPNETRMANRNALHHELVEAIAAGNVEKARALGGEQHRFDIGMVAEPAPYVDAEASRKTKRKRTPAK
jgi:DNA-binding FadR family transcriptional regulator